MLVAERTLVPPERPRWTMDMGGAINPRDLNHVQFASRRLVKALQYSSFNFKILAIVNSSNSE